MSAPCACGQTGDVAVLVGPIRGVLTLADGATTYDVTGHHVHVASTDHADELAHLVGLHYEQHGHPDHGPDDPPFEYHGVPEKFKGYKPHRANRLKGK